MPENPDALIHRNPFGHLPCDPCHAHGRRTSAAWFVGIPGLPHGQFARLCDGCARQMLANLPPELADAAGIAPPVSADATADECTPATLPDEGEREVAESAREV